MASRLADADDPLAFRLPGLDWWQRYTIDVIVLVLGVSANLRVWLGFFAVREWSFALPLILAAGCETVRRVFDANRSDSRPCLFTSDRRFDLIAALFLMTEPAPIGLPGVGFLSPTAWWRSLVNPPSLALDSGLAILAATVLQAANGARRSRVRPTPRIRDLAGIPDLHIATMIVAPDLRAA
jgi:hypothetical protein